MCIDNLGNSVALRRAIQNMRTHVYAYQFLHICIKNLENGVAPLRVLGRGFFELLCIRAQWRHELVTARLCLGLAASHHWRLKKGKSHLFPAFNNVFTSVLSIDWNWLLGWLISNRAIWTWIAPLSIHTLAGTTLLLMWRSQSKRFKTCGRHEHLN